MIAVGDTRIETTLSPRPSRAAVLSAGLHLLVLSAWILAPFPKPDDMGAGALTVQLLMEQPPPPEPEPPKPTPPQPAPEPKPAPKPEPVKAAPKPATAAKPAPTAAPVTSETAAQPVMSSPPEAAPEASAAATPAIAIGNPAARQAERDDYLRIVWARVMRFRPERVTLTGTTVLRFTLGADGSLMNASVTDSSGSGLLDRAALNALERAAPFPAPPSSVGDGLTFEIPFTFRPAG